MREILLVNPRKAKSMARKKKRKNPVGSGLAKRNPRSSIKRAAGRAFSGLSFQTAMKNLAPFQIGMLAAKFAEKKGPGGLADDTDPLSWGYGSYLKGALAGVAAAAGANMIRPGWGQRVLEGALNQVVSRIIRNELIEKSASMFARTRKEIRVHHQLAPGVWTVEVDRGQIEQVESEQMYVDTDGTPYLQGAGYDYLPLDDQHRMLPDTPGYYGDTLVRPGPLGDTLVRPGPLGQDDIRRYAEDYQG